MMSVEQCVMYRSKCWVDIKFIGALLVLILAFNLSAANARVDELVLQMRPEPGVVARVVRQPNWDVVLDQPFGNNIELPRPGKRKLGMPLPELHQIDIDFDGHSDLFVDFPEAKSDDPMQIIRYLPSERRYETLHLPTSPDTMCNWRGAVPDPEREVLSLTCKLGLLSVIETVQFNTFGMPWLSTRLIKDRFASTNRYPYIPMVRQFSRWDEDGQELEVDARDGRGHPIYLTIPVPRTSVYERPGEKARDDHYLTRGERVRLLDWMPRWLRVSREDGDAALEGWLWIPDAYDLAAQVGVMASAGGDFALTAGRATGDDVMRSLGDTFPISLGNNGVHPRTLEHPELHLLFYDRDGWHFWTKSLLNRDSITVHPGESVVLEAGPLFEDYGSYALAHPMPDEFESEIRIFKFDLSPGEYSVRVALTSPELDVPVYSSEHTFFHTPAHVPDGPCLLPESPEP